MPNGTISPPTTAQLMHPHTADVFEELSVARGRSWQYELQQLKKANQLLRSDVERLEELIEQEMETETRIHALRQRTQSNALVGTPWPSYSQSRSQHGRSSSKRTWDADGTTL